MIIIEALKETILMVLFSGVMTIILGTPVGLLLYATKNKHFFASEILHYLLHWPSTTIYSLPFLVIMIFCLPVTRWFISNHIPASLAATLPLIIAAIPLYANLLYTELSKLPSELAATAKSLGATPWQALLHMYLPEIFPSLIKTCSQIFSTLIGYSTISGLFGAGGLGYVLLQKGYYDFNLAYVFVCALILLILFQAIQYIGTILAEYITKK